MKTFHVYLHPARGYEAVQEGICLPALCFNVLWLLFRGLLVPAAVVTLAGALLFGAGSAAGENAVDELQAWALRSLMLAGVLVVWMTPFLYGNRWRHADLLRRGFAQVACLPARSGDDAIARALSLDSLIAPSSIAVAPAGGRRGSKGSRLAVAAEPGSGSGSSVQAEQGDPRSMRRERREARPEGGSAPELLSLGAPVETSALAGH